MFKNITKKQFILISLSAVLIFVFFPQISFGATKFWIGPSGGSFTSNSNWSTSSGGSNNTNSPGQNDVAVFDGGKITDVLIDNNINVAGIEIKNNGMWDGYTGTITQSTNKNIITGYWAQSAGVFLGASSGNITINGTFTLSGGTFNSTSGTMTASHWTHTSGGVFNHNNGTVIFVGYALIDVNSTETFYNLTFNVPTNSIINIQSDDKLKTIGTLSMLSGTVDPNIGNAYFEAFGNVYVNTSLGSSKMNLIFSGSADQIFNSSGKTNYFNRTITVNKTGGTVTLGSNLGVSNDLILTSGTLNLNSKSITSSNDYSRLVVNGTVSVTGPGLVSLKKYSQASGAISFNGSVSLSFYDFNLSGGTFNGGSCVITINGTFALSGGTFNSTSGTMTASHWTHTSGGVFNHNNGTVIFVGYALIDVNSTETFYNLTFNVPTNSIINIQSDDKLKTIGTLSMLSGTVDPNFGNAYFEAFGNVYVNTSFGSSKMDLTFSGSADQIFNSSGKTNYFNRTITVNKTGGTVTLGSNLGVSNDLILTSGTLNLNSKSITSSNDYSRLVVNGTVSVTGPGSVSLKKYSQASGAISFNGSVSLSFYDFNLSGGTFNGGSCVITINGTFTLSGGTFNSTSGTMTASHWTHTSGGVFNHNNGTVIFVGYALIDVNSTETFYNLTFNVPTNSIINIQSDDKLKTIGTLSMLSGTVDPNIGNAYFEAFGNVYVNTSLGSSKMNLIFSGSADQIFNSSGKTNYFNRTITVNKTGGTVTLGSNLVVFGNVMVTAGTFNMSNYIISNSSGSPLFTLSGGATLIIGNSNGISYSGTTGNIQVSGSRNFSSGANYVYSSASAQITGSGLPLTINNFSHTGSGTLTLTNNLTVNGSWFNSGVFSGQGKTVTFSSGQHQISGQTSFYNLSANPGATLTFTSGQTQTITNNFICLGTAINLIIINSTTQGVQASLSKSSGIVNCDYLNLRDSNATGGAVWRAGIHSINSGNNSGWWDINTAPIIDINPSDNDSSITNMTDVGENVVFTATAIDAQLENYYLAICKTNSITANVNAVPVCSDQSWCVSDLTVSGQESSCQYRATQQDVGSKAWYAFVCDHSPESKCLNIQSGVGDNDSPFVVREIYTIIASAGAGGSITPSGNIIVDRQNNQPFLIVPRTGYRTSEIRIDDLPVSVASPYVFYNVQANHSIVVSFEMQPTSGRSVVASGITGGSVWNQNNWSGGSGQQEFINNSKYYNDDGNVTIDVLPLSVRLLEMAGNHVPSGFLESSSFDTGTEQTNYTTIIWQPTSQNLETTVKFQIASNNDNETWNFKGPDGTENSFYTVPGTTINSVHNNNRYIRYKAFLSTENQQKTPVLSSVNINYVSGCFTPGQVMFSGLEARNDYEIAVNMAGYQEQIIFPLNIVGRFVKEILLSP